MQWVSATLYRNSRIMTDWLYFLIIGNYTLQAETKEDTTITFCVSESNKDTKKNLTEKLEFNVHCHIN